MPTIFKYRWNNRLQFLMVFVLNIFADHNHMDWIWLRINLFEFMCEKSYSAASAESIMQILIQMENVIYLHIYIPTRRILVIRSNQSRHHSIEATKRWIAYCISKSSFFNWIWFYQCWHNVKKNPLSKADCEPYRNCIWNLWLYVNVREDE